MILSAAIVLIGLLLGVTATQVWDLRLTGVIVVPLFALYTLYNVLSLPVLVISVAVAYWCLTVVSERTLLYGRRLLYTAMLCGALINFAIVGLLSVLTPFAYSVEMYAVGSILPGIAAYNLHRLEFERLVDDIVGSVSAYVALVAVGVAFVSERMAARIGTGSTMLFSSGSDVAQLRGVAVQDGGLGMTLDPVIAVSVLFLGLLVSMVIETTWNVRLFGIIALPLLALFTAISPAMLGLYAACLLTTYALLRPIHRQTLVYGRVLLSIALAIAVLMMVPIAMMVALPGQYLLFVALLAGLGAYNIHRLSSIELRRSTSLSTAVFGVFVLLVSALGSPPAVPGGAVTVGLLAAAGIVPGAVTAVRLEKRRKRDSESSSVYSGAV